MSKVLLPLTLRRLSSCVLLTSFMSVMVVTNIDPEEVVTEEITTEDECIEEEEIETEPIHYLTDDELSLLYSLNEQPQNDKCLELTVEDATLLMQIARAEGGESEEGQLWVMAAIMNRVASDEFPDSIYEVVSQENPTQFEVFMNGSYKKVELNSNSHMALAELEMGYNPTMGAVWFESNSNSDHSWHKSKIFIKEVEGNLFYR